MTSKAPAKPKSPSLSRPPKATAEPPLAELSDKKDAPKEAPDPNLPSYKKQYDRFLPDALALKKELVVSLRLDVHLVYANVQKGCSEVLPHKARFATELPKLDLAAIEALPSLVEALLYAHNDAAHKTMPMKRQEMEALFQELGKLREMMLLQAEVFALCGLVPENRVAQIRSGKGPFDTAGDGVALADLFREFETPWAGKHPFSKAQIARAAEVGNTLLQSITPDGARPNHSQQASKALDARDRMYSLLTLRHAELRKAGFYLFGEEVDQKVPVLGARAGKKQTDAPPSPPV